MHKFARNIGLCELMLIDHELRGHNFCHFIAYGKRLGISSDVRGRVVSRRKDRAKEEMNCGANSRDAERTGGRKGGKVNEEEAAGRAKGGNANRVKNVYNVSRGNNVAYAISSYQIFSRISWRHATQGTPSLFAARMSLY